MPLKSTLTHVLLIALVGIIIYSNTFDVPFQLDERLIIEENPVVKDLDYFLHPSKAGGLGLHYYNLRDRYVGYLSFALNYKLHRTDVTGYHIVNLVLHLFNSVLVYFLVVFAFRTPFLSGSALKGHSELAALFAGLLFVSHPLQTEAVTYIVRFPVLTAFFYLGSILFYLKWRLGDGVRGAGRSPMVFYIFSLFFALSAMKTKENAFTLPFMIALIEFSFFEGKKGRRLLTLAPFLLVALVIPLSHLGVDSSAGAVSGKYSVTKHYAEVSRGEYFYTQFGVIASYIGLLFAPFNQNFDHFRPIIRSFFDIKSLLPLFSLLTVLSSGVYLYRVSFTKDPSFRVISLGIFWFFLALSIESSLFPIPMIMCEYRVYLPSVGAFTALSVGFSLLALKKSKYNRLFIALTIIIIAVSAVSAYKRNSVWQSVGTLWEDAANKSPLNPRAHTALAYYYEKYGLFEKAKAHGMEAVRLAPQNIEAHYNLANVYKSMGQFEPAITHYEAAISGADDAFFLSSISYKAHYSLGVAYSQTGQPGLAENHYREAIRLRPDFVNSYNNLGTLYLQRGLIDEAIEQYEKGLKVDPSYAGAHYNLGLAYAAKKDVNSSISHYEEAIRLKPDFVEAMYNLAAIYKETGRPDRAEELYRRAASLKARQ